MCGILREPHVDVPTLNAGVRLLEVLVSLFSFAMKNVLGANLFDNTSVAADARVPLQNGIKIGHA